MNAKRFSTTVAIACLVAMLAGPATSLAQQTNASKSSQNLQSYVLIPGAMRGLGSMGPTGYRRLCSPLSVGLYEWRVRWIERWVKPSEAQKTALNDLATASVKAKEAITAACPKTTVATTTAELEVMEKRVAGILEALKIMRPAYEQFYTSLDSKQKAILDVIGPGRHGWRW